MTRGGAVDGQNILIAVDCLGQLATSTPEWVTRVVGDLVVDAPGIVLDGPEELLEAERLSQGGTVNLTETQHLGFPAGQLGDGRLCPPGLNRDAQGDEGEPHEHRGHSRGISRCPGHHRSPQRRACGAAYSRWSAATSRSRSSIDSSG